MAETRTERASCKVTFNEPKKGSRTGLLISSLYINRWAQESPAFTVAVCE